MIDHKMPDMQLEQISHASLILVFLSSINRHALQQFSTTTNNKISLDLLESYSGEVVANDGGAVLTTKIRLISFIS